MLRLCSANHRTGYFNNLACDWLSIVWAYSEQDTENRPKSSVICSLFLRLGIYILYSYIQNISGLGFYNTIDIDELKVFRIFKTTSDLRIKLPIFPCALWIRFFKCISACYRIYWIPFYRWTCMLDLMNEYKLLSGSSKSLDVFMIFCVPLRWHVLVPYLHASTLARIDTWLSLGCIRIRLNEFHMLYPPFPNEKKTFIRANHMTLLTTIPLLCR